MKISDPWAVAAICFTVAATIQVFNLGRMYQAKEYFKKIDKCSKKVLNDTKPEHLQIFYGHHIGSAGNAYNHAKAVVEMQMYECLQKELNR